MSDETKPSAPATEAAPATTAPADNATASETSKESKPAEKLGAAPAAEEPIKESGKAQASEEKPTDAPATSADVEMKDAPESAAPIAEAGAAKGESALPDKEAEAGQTATPDKTKARRKSTSGGASAKKLNKKASKARITHTDAKPGDHFFVKLKGFPQWPAIVCDEDMLPKALLDSRPVTAKRIDGTYRDEFADGGKRVGDRSFPVMYLFTNEFGWVSNTDLIELDTETVLEVKMDKMRKDLQAAYRLASENHPIAHYKGVLQDFQEELLAKQKAKEAKAAASGKKKKKEEVEQEDEEDVEMADADEDGAEAAKEKKASKKRKAEENIETPQRSDSVKKPKIKLTTNSTPKANGSATPKPSKAGSESKSSKSKSKKSKEPEEKKQEKDAATPKEPELTPEEKHQRKEKEVLFLRHKLQKGLLTREQEPKEEEMEMMSEYIGKLESFPDLEVSIIRATKINKVLKAILKLDNIPKESEFKFKPRSQVLLDKWNKLLADVPAEAANGVNGAAATKEKEAGAKTNGVKEHSETPKEPVKQDPKAEEAAAEPSAANEKKEPEAVEATA